MRYNTYPEFQEDSRVPPGEVRLGTWDGPVLIKNIALPKEYGPHKFVYGWAHGNYCCQWFPWLGSPVICGLKENDPIHKEEI